MKARSKLTEAVREVSVRGRISVVLALLIAGLYLFRPLALEAVTVWPSWIWLLPGVVISLTMKRKLIWKAVRWPLLAWFLVGALFSEVRSVVSLPAARPLARSEVLRVVTFNLSGEMTAGLKEIAEHGPDIVLVQESASVSDLGALVDEALGSDYEAVVGVDCSVFVKGRIVEEDTSSTNFTLVRAVLESGAELYIVSLRMYPPWPRLDYWTLDCWRSYSEHRVDHIDELKEIWSSVTKICGDSPVIFGGDFNVVPCRGITEVFEGEMTDSFKVSGRGWYATALNSMPLFRIDQVWSSGELRAYESRSYRSAVSDHRSVVADFVWEQS